MKVKGAGRADTDAKRAIVAQRWRQLKNQRIHIECKGVTDRCARGARHAAAVVNTELARFYHSSFLAFHRTPGVVLNAE